MGGTGFERQASAALSSYQNVSGVTAAAGDVLSSKVIVNAKGETVEASIPVEVTLIKKTA